MKLALVAPHFHLAVKFTDYEKDNQNYLYRANAGCFMNNDN